MKNEEKYDHSVDVYSFSIGLSFLTEGLTDSASLYARPSFREAL